MVIVGVPPVPAPLSAMSLIFGNKKLAGSLIGGIAETQEMLDYCAAKKIVADVEVIPAGRSTRRTSGCSGATFATAS